jgi:hypothetical protein
MQQSPFKLDNPTQERRDIHFLPCTINQSGPCPVSDFFVINNLEAAFHGRKLPGHKLDVSLAILEKHEG